MYTIEDIISDYRQAESEIRQLLADDNEPPIESLTRLDRSLANSFDQIVNLSVSDPAERRLRVIFLVQFLREGAEASSLSEAAICQIQSDINALLKHLHRPRLGVVKGSAAVTQLEPNLTELCYSSLANGPVEEEDLKALIDQARKYNEKNQITGLLIFDNKAEKFYHVLEGPKNRLQAVMDRIIHDPRHHEIEIRFQSPISARAYHNNALNLVTTRQISQELSPDADLAGWLQRVLALKPAARDSRGHRWMVQSVEASML